MKDLERSSLLLKIVHFLLRSRGSKLVQSAVAKEHRVYLNKSADLQLGNALLHLAQEVEQIDNGLSEVIKLQP